MVLRLTLIAHARTRAQKLACFAVDEAIEPGWSEVGLKEFFSARNTRFICGPELRARQTAELFSTAVQADNGLRDCDFRRWRGRSIDYISETEPEALLAWMHDWQAAPHGGESVEQLCQRVREWMAGLTGTGHIVAVTHPLILRAALMNVLQCPPPAFHSIDIEPLSMIDLRCNGKWRIRVAPSP